MTREELFSSGASVFPTSERVMKIKYYSPSRAIVELELEKPSMRLDLLDVYVELSTHSGAYKNAFLEPAGAVLEGVSDACSSAVKTISVEKGDENVFLKTGVFESNSDVKEHWYKIDLKSYDGEEKQGGFSGIIVKIWWLFPPFE